MSHQSDQANGVENPPLRDGNISNSHYNSGLQKIQVQLTTKKKKEIINLQSSSEKEKSPQESPEKPVSSSIPKDQKKIKSKKVQHKCQLCKGAGKKVEMKKCMICKNYTHLQCLDENEGKGKFTCDKCKAANLNQENKAQKKQKKQEDKIQIAKAIQKKMEKQKKKDESNRTLQKFKEKYPFYIGEGEKIKFPIEDKLLFIYKEYFQSGEAKMVPSDHPLIPGQYLGYLLQIENFIVSFGKEFQQDYSGDYRKSALYVLMNCNGSDKTFQRLLGAIIKIYLKDIFEKNKTENVKILNDNCFFILLGTVNEIQQMSADYVALTATEIIRHLGNVPSMKNSFKDFTFPTNLNLESKLKVLASLIQGLSEVDGFHDMVSRKSEKISEMTKDKADFIVKLKKNQAEALSNKEKLKQMLGKTSKLSEGMDPKEQMEQQNKDKNKIASKQAQKTKKKTQKLASEGEVSERVIKQFKSKIVMITKKIPFVISEILFLGSDRNNAEYFFYLREPNRLYVRYRNYILDESEEFKIYETKQKIIQLMKSLNTKGVHEKRLYQSIHSLVKQDTIRNLLPEQCHQLELSADQTMDDCIFLERDQQFREKVINDVMSIEEKFSDYLWGRSYRWATQSKRQQFRFGFPYIEDIQALKQQIKNLQQSFLFVDVIREIQVNRDESESNEEVEREQIMPNEREMSRRKKPIRIWGINSERVKKFWVEYLQTCINYTGIWISVNIFKNYVDKYIEKKMETIREQAKKESQQKEKQLREKKIKEQKEKEKQERNLDRLRSRNKPKLMKKNRQNSSVSPIEAESESEEGIKTRRHLRPSNRAKSRPLTIDSDEDEKQGEQEEVEEVSDNEDECHICKDTGEVICCDTCPKVFHLGCLGLKETPEGEWSCIDCLYKINNERQTRSRARKMGR